MYLSELTNMCDQYKIQPHYSLVYENDKNFSLTVSPCRPSSVWPPPLWSDLCQLVQQIYLTSGEEEN